MLLQDNGSEFRQKRLAAVRAAVELHAHHSEWDLNRCVASLEDARGWLTVQWRQRPTEAQKALFRWAWANVGGETREMVEHIVPIEPPSPRTFVYVIRNTDDGTVKIGFSANPKARLRELQIGASTRLVLVGMIPGGRAEEAALHSRFSVWRLSGEWFEEAPEVGRWIADHVAPGAPR